MPVDADMTKVDEPRVADAQEGIAGAVGIHHAMQAFVAEEAALSAPVDDGTSIEAIKARLAERGLLVKGPAIVVPKEPRPDKPVVLDDVLAEVQDDLHPNAVPEDDWDLEPEGGALVPVRCPQCRGTQQTSVDVTRFRCHTCERAWRWAVCQKCDEVAFTVERQESWLCRCGHFSRSWWRTDTATREAPVVVARRRDLAARAERARVRAGMRKRRWKIVAGGVAGLLAVGIFVGVVRASEPTVATGTAETCRLFERLRSDLGSGTLDADELNGRLDGLLQASDGAEPAVRDPAVELAAVAKPSRAAFLVASTQLSDACTAFQAKR